MRISISRRPRRRAAAVVAMAGLAIVATGASLSIGATEAHADTTPVLWGIENSSGDLYSIDATSGNATLVPRTTPGTNPGSAVAVALNPLTNSNVVLLSDCSLDSLNVATGAIDPLGITLNNGSALSDCSALAIDGHGVGWVTYGPQNNAWVASVNLATGASTTLPTQPSTYMDCLWFDPSAGTLYGQDDNSGNVVTISQTTGAETDSGVALAPYSYGVIIDGSGHYWANGWSALSVGTAGVWTSGTQVGSGFGAAISAFFSTTSFWPASPTPTPTPTQTSTDSATGLATTGFNVLGVAAFASLALTGGAIALGVRRLRSSA